MMKLTKLKRHLQTYSIYQERKTTINHAFASALAPCDSFEDKRVREAMSVLGQTDSDHLTCVYCGQLAETWDHLVGLVKNSHLHGYGHQIGNLVPCCRDCNSKKGNKPWKQFLREFIDDRTRRKHLEKTLEEFIAAFAVPVDVEQLREKCSHDWIKYEGIRERIFELMQEADTIAGRLREHVTKA